MSKILIFLSFFLLTTQLAFAQSEQDRTSQKRVSYETIDSLGTQKQQKLDSLQDKVDYQLGSTQNLSDKVDRLGDSLKPDLSRYSHSLDSMQNKLSYRIDSLNNLQLPTQKYTCLLDSLSQLGPVKSIDQARQRVAGVQGKINTLEGKENKPFSVAEQKVNEKLSLMRKEGGEGANLPGNVDLPEVDTPGLPGIGASLPGQELGIPDGSAGISNQLGEAKVGSMPDLSGNIPSIDGLEEVQGSIGEVSKVTSQVSAYGDDIKNIGSGNLDEVKQLPETLENEAIKRGQLGDLQEQTNAVDEYKEILSQGNDKETLKQQALKQAPKLAKNHFKGQEVALQEAIGKVTSLKKNYTELTNLEDLPKRQPNIMKGKPLVERIVPGITMQIQKAGNVWFDYNPYVGYKISGRLTAGLGWNERIGITSRFGFTAKDRVYGPRTFVDFRFKKGFSIRADVEQMRTFIPPNALNLNPTDLGSHQWVWSAFIGLKKQYDFVKSVKGNFQILYNLYDDHDNSPYTNRLSIRFGFEFPMRKKLQPDKDQ